MDTLINTNILKYTNVIVKAEYYASENVYNL